jgi:hypothetical protein
MCVYVCVCVEGSHYEQPQNSKEEKNEGLTRSNLITAKKKDEDAAFTHSELSSCMVLTAATEWASFIVPTSPLCIGSKAQRKNLTYLPFLHVPRVCTHTTSWLLNRHQNPFIPNLTPPTQRAFHSFMSQVYAFTPPPGSFTGIKTPSFHNTHHQLNVPSIHSCPKGMHSHHHLDRSQASKPLHSRFNTTNSTYLPFLHVPMASNYTTTWLLNRHFNPFTSQYTSPT